MVFCYANSGSQLIEAHMTSKINLDFCFSIVRQVIMKLALLYVLWYQTYGHYFPNFHRHYKRNRIDFKLKICSLQNSVQGLRTQYESNDRTF